MRIMPPYLPAHRGLVLASGAAEIAGGIGVLLPDSLATIRRAAAWELMLLLIAVFPAFSTSSPESGCLPATSLR
jgi:uncharacterized membrane protein